MKDYFLENLHDETSKRDVMVSPLWPVAVACINQTNGGLVVGDVYKFDNGRDIMSLSLVTPDGFQVGCVHRDDTESDSLHRFGAFSSPFRASTTPWHDVFDNVKSKKIPYIIRKLKTAGTEPYNALHNAHANARTAVNKLLRDLADKVVGETKARRPYRIVELDEAPIIDLLRYYKNEIGADQITGQSRHSLEKAYEKYKGHINEAREGYEESLQFFDKDKWVVFNRINRRARGVIIGAVGRQPLLNSLALYKQNGSFPDSHAYSYLDMIVPFKWYPSVDEIPEDIRRDVEMQLTMAKVNLNLEGHDLLNVERQSVPVKVIPELGAYMGGDYYSANVYVVDKNV